MKYLGAFGSSIVVLLLVASCSRTPAQHPAQPNNAPDEELKISSVTMHRSACYGPCPIYSVTARSDGTVAYNGERHVKMIGDLVGTISADDFAYLTQSINRLGFSNWNNQYQSEKDGCKSVWTDSSTVDITVVSASGKKRVTYYYGCRGFALAPKIDLLSKIIDDVTDSQKWVGVEE